MKWQDDDDEESSLLSLSFLFHSVFDLVDPIDRSADSTGRIWTIVDDPSVMRSALSKAVVLKHFRGSRKDNYSEVTSLEWNVSLSHTILICF